MPTQIPKKEGKLHGRVEIFWPNGALKRSCDFEEGIRHGIDQMFSEWGVLLDRGQYERGTPTGVHRRYSESGALLEEVNYLEQGGWHQRCWDEEGNCIRDEKHGI